MKDIEDLMREQLKNDEIRPPADAWQTIEHRLSQGSVSTTRGHSTAWIVASAVVVVLVVVAVMIHQTLPVSQSVDPKSEMTAELMVANGEEDMQSTEFEAIAGAVAEDPVAVKRNTGAKAIVEETAETTPRIEKTAVSNNPSSIDSYRGTTTNPAENSTTTGKAVTVPVVTPDPNNETYVPAKPTSGLGKTDKEIAVTEPKDDAPEYKKPSEKSLPTNIVIPNLVTPNGDGYNDCWIIPNLNQYGETSVQIYTAQSQRVYSSSNYRNDFCGADLPDGNYFYVIVFKEINTTRRGVLVIKH